MRSPTTAATDAEPADTRDLPPADDRWATAGRRAASSGWLLAVAWVLSRAVMLRSWAHSYTYITGDPKYYDWEFVWVPTLQARLREYPVPVVWFLQFFRWAVHDDSTYYVTAFAIGMAVLDAAFALALWSAGARLAAWYWSAFGFFMGSLLWFRFDVLPAVIVGGALLLVSRRPRASGALVALGAAIKLWPALVLLPLVHRDERGRRRVATFAAAGVVLALVSWAAAGTTRLVSPLSWQDSRGLQIESITGSVLVAAYAFTGRTSWNIQLSSYNAFEIYGPGVSTALAVSTVLMLLAGLLAIALGVLAWRRRFEPFTATMGAVAIIAAFIVANKTLSPQYMFWLGAPIAVLVHQARTPQRRVRAAVLAGLGLLIAALTQVVYPGHYSEIIYAVPPDSTLTTVLLVRNTLTVIAALTAAWWALRPGPDAAESADENADERADGVPDEPDDAPGDEPAGGRAVRPAPEEASKQATTEEQAAPAKDQRAGHSGATAAPLP